MNGDIPAVPVTTLAGLASLTQRKYSTIVKTPVELWTRLFDTPSFWT